jgi:hypothetical protein
MNEYSVFDSSFAPNDEQPVLVATIFYAGNAGFPSYFGKFRKFIGKFMTYAEAGSALHQRAIHRDFAGLALCVAIV